MKLLSASARCAAPALRVRKLNTWRESRLAEIYSRRIDEKWSSTAAAFKNTHPPQPIFLYSREIPRGEPGGSRIRSNLGGARAAGSDACVVTRPVRPGGDRRVATPGRYGPGAYPTS